MPSKRPSSEKPKAGGSAPGQRRTRCVRRKSGAAFVGILLALALIFLGLSFIVSNGIEARAATAEYALIIDAGSSGSRIHLYEWQPKDDDRILEIKEIPLDKDCNRVDGGLSTLGDYDTDKTATAVRESLTLLITCAQLELIDSVENFQKIPLHLMATAGMRMLKGENKKRYYEIMGDVLAYLRSTPFHFGGARVIEGQEEALYAWIAANYSNDSLGEASSKETVGILELGGASAQIAFVPRDSTDSNSKDFAVVRIGVKEHQVYAQGYDGVGKNEIIVNFKETKFCYPIGYITTAWVLGTGKYDECKKQIEERFEQKNKKIFKEIRDARLPNYDEKYFLALSNLYYTLDFLKDFKQDNLELFEQDNSEPVKQGNLKISELDTVGGEYCKKKWMYLLENYTKTPENFLSEYCFMSVYIPILLEEVFGENSIKGRVMLRLDLVGDKKGADVDWTLGALICALYECGFGH